MYVYVGTVISSSVYVGLRVQLVLSIHILVSRKRFLCTYHDNWTHAPAAYLAAYEYTCSSFYV